MNISKYLFKESDMRAEIINQIGKSIDSRLANLANCEIADEEILEILKMIKKIQPKISEINLDNNKLTDQCAIILEKYLSNFKQLQTLSIQYNQIGRAGAISLFSIKKAYKNSIFYFMVTGYTILLKWPKLKTLLNNKV